MRHNKVLIIDDEPELRNLIKRLLELEGFSILTWDFRRSIRNTA